MNTLKYTYFKQIDTMGWRENASGNIDSLKREVRKVCILKQS